MGNNLKIPRRGSRCCLCASQLKKIDSYYSLIEALQGEMNRSDYCAHCWEEDRKLSESEALWWQGSCKKEEIPGLTDEDQHWLTQFGEAHEEGQDEEILYFLASLLKRRGIFIRRSSGEHQDKPVEIFEDKRSGETYLVPKVDIDPEEIQNRLTSWTST